jgi:hypothetical protein
MDDWRIFAHEAAAVGRKAIQQGVARRQLSEKELFDNATRMINRSHELTEMMMDKGFIARSPIDRQVLDEEWSAVA